MLKFTFFVKKVKLAFLSGILIYFIYELFCVSIKVYDWHDRNPRKLVIKPNGRRVYAKDKSIDIYNVFEILYDVKAFIVEKDFLKSLFVNNQSYYVKASHKTGRPIHLTFGIDSSLFNHTMLKRFMGKYGSQLKLKKSQGLNTNGISTLTTIYIFFDNIRFQISVFYQCGTFQWIGKDETFKNLANNYGDTQRAMPGFSIGNSSIQLMSKSNHLVSYPVLRPESLDMYLYHYEKSRLIGCNRTSALINTNNNETYKQDPVRNRNMLDGMTYIASVLENLLKPYWITDGTLLGVIPHTTDADFAIYEKDYDIQIKNKFLGNVNVSLWLELGLLNDSHELRLENDYFDYDIFTVYDYNLTHVVSGYHYYGQRFRQVLKKLDEICSVDLFGYKFFAPCDPIEYLSCEYGPNIEDWLNPKTGGYFMANLERISDWSTDEWLHVIRYYRYNGSLNINKTLYMLNYYNPLKNSTEITELPEI